MGGQGRSEVGPGGNGQTVVTIAASELPPSIAYIRTSISGVKNSAITPDTATSTGGPITRYSVSPALPAGLVLDTVSGIVSGTPTVVATSANYTVTATGPGGNGQTVVTVAVADVPASISYVRSSINATRNSAITPDTALSTGGAVDSFVVSPALPAGLSLNKTTGIISGTPTAAAASANYTVTAMGPGGNGQAVVSISVVDLSPVIAYVRSSINATKRMAITPDTATNTGGPITGYSVSPALPAGLVLDTVSGIVSGTPTVVSASANYTVTATGPGGSGQTVLTIAVQDTAPAFSYRTTPVLYARGTVAASDSVISTGGSVTVYHVSPALPAGLTLDTVTGVIGGVPTASGLAANYTVTASGPGGTGTAIVNIRVVSPPSNLSYPDDPVTYVVGVVSTPNVPSVAGYVTHYSVSPSLPAGMRIDSVNGIISGTPTIQSFGGNYTVTASSFAGSTTYTLSVAVVGAPSNLSYADDVPTYGVGTAIIPPNTPNLQGIVTLYSVSPALPAGMTFDQTTGYIGGTPTSATAATTYTVTAQNPGGSTSATVTITVIVIP